MGFINNLHKNTNYFELNHFSNWWVIHELITKLASKIVRFRIFEFNKQARFIINIINIENCLLSQRISGTQKYSACLPFVIKYSVCILCIDNERLLYKSYSVYIILKFIKAKLKIYCCPIIENFESY